MAARLPHGAPRVQPGPGHRGALGWRAVCVRYLLPLEVNAACMQWAGLNPALSAWCSHMHTFYPRSSLMAYFGNHTASKLGMEPAV